MKARELLKEATSLKKKGKIEEAIKILDKAFLIGDLERPSNDSNSGENNEEFNNFYTVEDLARKAKYLQELGKINDALNFLDNLINETIKKTRKNVWEIFELGKLFQHRAIILKKEKRFNESFVDRVKSYCIDGIATRLTVTKFDANRIKNIIINKINQKFILDFFKKDLEKLSFKIDQFRLAGFIMKTIMFENNSDKILKDINNYIKY